MGKWWKPVGLLVLTFAAAVSIGNDFVFFLLGFELMVYLAAFCQARWLSQKVRLRVGIPQTQVCQGESFPICAELTNLSGLPVPQLTVRLAVRAFPEKEELLLKGKVMLDGGEQGKVCFQLDSSHCGCLEVRPDQLMVSDLLGIFQCRSRIDRDEKHLLFILPDPSQVDREMPDAQAAFPDEEGTGERQGDSMVDVSEIRSYQKGDSMKRVHWKLSARLNELMVREMAEPTEQLAWIYVDLSESADRPTVRRDPDAWDRFVGTVASVSATLLKMEKRHMVIWIDGDTDRVVRHSVSDELGMQEMLCGLLRADSFSPRDHSQLLKEIFVDETKDTCIEIYLQGNLSGSKKP